MDMPLRGGAESRPLAMFWQNIDALTAKSRYLLSSSAPLGAHGAGPHPGQPGPTGVPATGV